MKNLLLFFLLITLNFYGQKERKSTAQLSNFLSKSYFSVNLGGVFYPFSNANLKEGFATESFTKNVFSGRFLLGYKIKPDLAIQFGVMRPASWFIYNNVNNIGYERSVWINVWSLSLKKSFNLNNKLSLFAEAGIANATRIGFSINDEVIYDDAHFGSLIYGLGANYKLNDKWRLSLNGTFLPKTKKYNQPSISQASVGFEYHLQQVPKEKALGYEENKTYFFPKNIIQVSYGTSAIGFGVNQFFGMSLKVGNFDSFGIPVFWVGDVKASDAYSITYQKTAFRSKKTFSLDWGVSATYFQSQLNKEKVYAFSVFPVLRFYLLRRKGFDMYTNYSVIGPTFITKKQIDGLDSGPLITYQDTMGLGVFFGENRTYNFELRIMHYSNGNIFTKNVGVAIPLQFTLGKTF
ncbi:acyloxyacyl hydrolase [Thalassobellus sediminis]|uniref:acyloxyacyl hydrolase n=1 Tax=Thalassobellus sediminis TaxID=3367753 RepID=UPI0037A48960